MNIHNIPYSFEEIENDKADFIVILAKEILKKADNDALTIALLTAIGRLVEINTDMIHSEKTNDAIVYQLAANSVLQFIVSEQETVTAN